MVKYKISLKPLSEFYFGQEKYRYINDDNQIEVEEANYNLKSGYYPQQTALLGMLRKEVLKAKGHYRQNFEEYLNHYYCKKETINQLIGEESFKFEKKQSFGLIKYISPLILANKDDYYMPMPKNLIFNKENSVNNTISTIELDDFNPKKYNPTQLVRINKENSKYVFSEIIPFESTTLYASGPYLKKSQVRIKRSKNGMTQEDSYFKQDYYILKSGYEFVFWADFEEDVLQNQIVEVGGNNSLFKMKVEKVQEDSYIKIVKEANESINTNLKNLLILSPTFLSQEDYKKIKSGFIDTIGFRNTWMNSWKYQKSDKKYYLLDAGSIIISENVEEIKEIQNKILSNKQLYNIGYNHAII